MKNTDFKSEKKPLSSSSICQIALAGAMICVLSMVSIPLPFGVPITLQTMAVSLAGLALGQKKGAAAVCVYLALGALGLPVFSGFKGGFSVIVGTTGGYIIGFMFIPLIYIAVTKLFGESFGAMLAALAAGLCVCYAFGTAWFYIVYAAKSESAGLFTILGWCVFPFIIPDLIKAAGAVVFAKRLSFIVKKLRLNS